MTASDVLIALYPGVSAFEALGALATLRAASVPARLVAPEALVRAQEGARIVPEDLGYDALPAAPAVVLPHGDVTRALADPALARALRQRRGHFTLAGGDAVRLLHAAGLAEGRRVACVPGEAPLAGTTPVHARLVADARLLTCFPGDALLDLVLHYVGHEHGHERALRAAGALGREHKPFAFGQDPR
jgi:transcriptional regulator GlxA family with amidase domain